MGNEKLHESIGRLNATVASLEKELKRLNDKLYSVDQELSQFQISKTRIVGIILGVSLSSSLGGAGMFKILSLIQ